MAHIEIISCKLFTDFSNNETPACEFWTFALILVIAVSGRLATNPPVAIKLLREELRSNFWKKIMTD